MQDSSTEAKNALGQHIDFIKALKAMVLGKLQK